MTIRMTRQIRLCALLSGIFGLAALSGLAGDLEPLVTLRGTDFAGGAQSRFGPVHFGERHTNFVYAEPTSAFSRMTASFRLEARVATSLALHMLACNSDLGDPCEIVIELNGVQLFAGPNRFPNGIFHWERLDVPVTAWRQGVNELTIRNVELTGELGQPPWFMLARCIVADPDMEMPDVPSITQDFRVDMPNERRPFPTPLAEGEEPGFAIRGTKGWLWRSEQYMAVLPTLAACQGNFLMICYGSMWNIEGYPEWPEKNAWWLPLPEPKRLAYAELFRACQERGVQLCFSMNPNLSSSRIIDYQSPDHMDALWQHYQWFQSLGMTWFSLCLDDITDGIDAAGQAKVANELLRRLRAQDDAAQLVFCPTIYWGDGSGGSSTQGGHEAYLSALADQLAPDIYLFWTGDQVVTSQITVGAASAFRRRSGHRLILWDNYPVNDGSRTLHLGPVSGREPGLADVCDGYMSNPLASQHEINSLPLQTCLDYAWNPRAYDPAASIGQALLRVAETPAQVGVLKDLVELFPGMLVHGQGTAFNPVMNQLGEMLDTPHSRHLADVYIAHVKNTADELEQAFAPRFAATTDTLAAIVADMVTLYRAAYGTEPELRSTTVKSDIHDAPE